jgi:hypothetical protein
MDPGLERAPAVQAEISSTVPRLSSRICVIGEICGSSPFRSAIVCVLGSTGLTEVRGQTLRLIHAHFVAQRRRLPTVCLDHRPFFLRLFSVPLCLARLTSASSVESSSPKPLVGLLRLKAPRCRFYASSLRALRLCESEPDTHIYNVRSIRTINSPEDMIPTEQGMILFRPAMCGCLALPSSVDGHLRGGRWSDLLSAGRPLHGVTAKESKNVKVSGEAT